MKYIKYFENFGRFEIGNELYKQISDHDFWDIMENFGKVEEITDNEIKSCTKLVENYINSPYLSIESVKKATRWYSDSIKNVIHFSIDSERYLSDEYYIAVNKYDDEWWLIETYLPHNQYLSGGGDYAHYIADSTEGLENWANNAEWQKIIKNK